MIDCIYANELRKYLLCVQNMWNFLTAFFESVITTNGFIETGDDVCRNLYMNVKIYGSVWENSYGKETESMARVVYLGQLCRWTPHSLRWYPVLPGTQCVKPTLF